MAKTLFQPVKCAPVTATREIPPAEQDLEIKTGNFIVPNLISLSRVYITTRHQDLIIISPQKRSSMEVTLSKRGFSSW